MVKSFISVQLISSHSLVELTKLSLSLHEIYQRAKELNVPACAIAGMDIALWDWFGKKYKCSVKNLLGGFKNKLPAYASTYHGDRNGGLDCKEAYADFAEKCYDIGYKAFKIHGWNDGNPKEEAENVLHVAKTVGDKMTLMLDPACELKTFAEKLSSISISK